MKPCRFRIPWPFRSAAWGALCLFLSLIIRAQAPGEGGDQFLDGIGETALIARYRLDGTTADHSRNGWQATLTGTGGTFVEDAPFGRVLSLPGTAGLELPGMAIEGSDSLTMAGWVFLRSEAPGQRFFDFGAGGAEGAARGGFSCDVTGEAGAAGFGVRLGAGGAGVTPVGVEAAAVPRQRWVHLAVVLDPPRHTLSLYLDGGRVAHATNLTLNLEAVLDPDDARRNRLLVGRSRAASGPGLDAKLHDLRLYGIALTEAQIAAIHRNGRAGGAATGAGGAKPLAAVGDAGPGAEADASFSGLVRVPDVKVGTRVGVLPRLPRTVPAEYRGRAAGPPVRILWPAPTNNASVLAPGTLVVTGRVAGTTLTARAVVKVRPAPAARKGPARQLETFPLDRVTLDPDDARQATPLMRHRDKFVGALAKSDPDRFLYMFRDAFGQPQPSNVEPLGGWDSPTTRLRGHASGHYLTAIAQAYASTGYNPALQAEFRRKMDCLIDTLAALAGKSGRPAVPGGPFEADPTKVPPGPGRTNYDSNLSHDGIRTDYWNWGVGFLSAYPPDQFIMLERGATYGGGNHQIWAPYYTLHKILAGLLDCYEVGGNRKALAVAEGMGRWVQRRLEAVPPATRISMWNRYIAGEYGGMNEVMARLARITGDRDFLAGARLFDNVDFFFGNAAHAHGLAGNVDTLRGKHANQHIPQITGALETYRNTGEVAYHDVAENFWFLCTEGYRYSIGGVAGAKNPNNAECFTAQPDTLFANGFARGGQNETCATYNLLKLSRQLFLFDPRGGYMDYYEQALYNDILASVAAGNSANTYHIPLNPGARKQFGNGDLDGFTCCNGTALESGTKLQDSIYFRRADDQALYVNLFVPSTLRWSERQVTLTQRTGFPYDDTTRLTLGGGGRFELRIRVPRWAEAGVAVRINGRAQPVKAAPGSYLGLKRTWQDGDTVEVRLPFRFHLERVMDRPNLASLFYGPVLLAAEEAEPRADWRHVVWDATDLGKSISGDPRTLRFTAGDVGFRPFWEMYGRYSVYLDVKLK